MQYSSVLDTEAFSYPFDSTKTHSCRVLVASRDKKYLDETTSQLQGIPDCNVSSHLILNGNLNPLVASADIPDILIFKVGKLWRSELAELPHHLSGLIVEKIIVSDNDDQECMRMAIQAGAKDFISPPLSSNELLESIQRLRSEMGVFKKKGQLVALINAKGGSGSSFIASNLAHIMSSIKRNNVVLMDLDIQFGALCHYLNMEPQRGLIEAIEHIEEMDEVALNAYLIKHKSGLKILETNPQTITLSEDIQYKNLGLLIDLILTCNDQLVVDLPRQIDLITSTVLERADKIILIVQQDIATVRDATRLVSILRKDLGLHSDKFQVVVNRHDKHASISVADIDKLLQTTNTHIIPNDFDNVHTCIDSGTPLYDHNKNAKSTRAIISLEETLMGNPNPPASGLLSRFSSYFNRL